MNGHFSRRDFLKKSAMFGGAAAIALSTPAGIFGQGVVSAQSTDLDVLNFAYTLEGVAIAAYKAAAGTGILPKPVLDVGLKFAGQHAEHQAALAAAIKQATGTNPNPPAGPFNFPALKTTEDILTFAKTLEEVAVGAYYSSIGKLQNPQYAAAAASIIGIEAEHVAVLSAALKQDPIPASFVTGASEADVNKAATSILTAPSSVQGAAAMPSGMPSSGAGGGSSHSEDFTGAIIGMLGVAGVAAAAVGYRARRATKSVEVNQETEQQ